MTRPIKSATFVKSTTRPEHAPEPRPAVAFAGRSNVGKSSLINRLTGQRQLARASSTPGRTREINYFEIDEQYYFIDLPGYGYAKVAESVRRQWGPMMERFFHNVEGLRLVVMIIDVRRDPNDDDMQMLSWLDARSFPYIFAVTKCDKLSNTQVRKRLKELQKMLGLEDETALLPLSSSTGAGIPDLLGVIRASLDEADAELASAASSEPKPENETNGPPTTGDAPEAADANNIAE